MNNKGISLVFTLLVMSIIFVIVSVMWKMGINDISLVKQIDNENKAYYIAEAGIYYSGSVILEAVQMSEEPLLSYTVNNPFNDYKRKHGFDITITKEDTSYRVMSEGKYNDSRQVMQSLVTINGNDIIYTEMKKVE